ncbi:MAG: class II aldolase/adducin family protein [bacterium]
MSKYEQYKKDVLRYSQMMLAKGYTVGTGGNVSILVEGEDLIAITPSNKEYMELTPADICIVDFDLNMIEGRFNPSRETGLHIAVYRNRRDAGAVIHSHPIYTSIFALINKSVPAIFDEVTMNIGNIIDVIPYALSGSDELVEHVRSKLSNRCNCYILQNHGALTIGTNIERAFRNMELMEKAAQIYYYALTTGEKPTVLPSDIADLLFQLLKAEQDNAIEQKGKKNT